MATISPSKEVNKLYDKLLGYFNPKDQAYINRVFQYAYEVTMVKIENMVIQHFIHAEFLVKLQQQNSY